MDEVICFDADKLSFFTSFVWIQLQTKREKEEEKFPNVPWGEFSRSSLSRS